MRLSAQTLENQAPPRAIATRAVYVIRSDNALLSRFGLTDSTLFFRSIVLVIPVLLAVIPVVIIAVAQFVGHLV